jgi:hypothetical protein
MDSFQGTGRLNRSKGGSARQTVSFKKVRSIVFQKFVALMCL